MDRLTAYQQSALDIILQHGRGNPIRGKDVANAIGLKPRSTGKEGADMRSIINALRVKGWPVCASGKGYYWPASQEELSAYVASFRARLADQSKAIAGMEFGFDKVGQPTGKAAAQAQKELYYEVRVNGEIKVWNIAGSREAEFLEKFPDAKKV